MSNDWRESIRSGLKDNAQKDFEFFWNLSDKSDILPQECGDYIIEDSLVEENGIIVKIKSDTSNGIIKIIGYDTNKLHGKSKAIFALKMFLGLNIR